jgi:serine/threonine protein kinase
MTLNSQDLIGNSVGTLVIEELIGEGGFAWVFSARRTDDGSRAALKILKPRYSGDREFEARFRNEYALASELVHPNVVRILDVGNAGTLTYFSMDLYPDSLAFLIGRETRVDEASLLRIAADITAGLAYAHERGIVHRDIKPDNILLQSDGTAVISDFGIAKAVSGYVTATGVNMTIGTPQYISPEQAQGRKLDGRSDLYSLGVTLYKAATGEPPFRSTDWFELARMHVEEPPQGPRKLRPDLSERFERIVLRCLAKHPDDRYASSAQLLEELHHVADSSRTTGSFGIAPTPTAELKARRPKDKRHTWVVYLLAVLMVAIVAAVVVMLGR